MCTSTKQKKTNHKAPRLSFHHPFLVVAVNLRQERGGNHQSDASGQLSQSAAEGVQRQPCLALHCCLDDTCHALHTAAALLVRDGHHSPIASQHLVSESHTTQEPAKQKKDLTAQPQTMRCLFKFNGMMHSKAAVSADADMHACYSRVCEALTLG